MSNIWECKIGETDRRLPQGSDLPMRNAIREAYFKITGEYPTFIFSGWGAELTDTQRKIIDNE